MSEKVFRSLPPEVAGLGGPLAYFPNRPWRCLRGSALGLAGMVVGLLFISAPACYCLARGLNESRSDFLLGGLFLLGVAAAAVVGLAHALRPVLESARVRGVVTFAAGIGCLEAGAAVPVAWDAVIEVGDTARALRTRDGRTVELPPSLDDWPLIADLILRSTYPPLTFRAEAEIASGETVDFGPVRVRGEGLIVLGTLIPWRDLRDTRVERGALTLAWAGSRHSPVRIPLGAVPNWHVLWGMLGRHTAGFDVTPTAEPGAWTRSAE